ncbi:MAG: TRAP transporter substrate-binding protein [Brachybacterium sp.]|nr:TRAP transporter substrate-binding protein [Brachybacterium sp.]
MPTRGRSRSGRDLITPSRRSLLRGGLAAGIAGSGALALGACGAEPERSSEGASADEPFELTLAHNLGGTHPTSHALEQFAADVEENSDGRLAMTVYSGGVLGGETEAIEQVQRGILDMVRVASPGLAPYAPGYHTFGLPFVFEDEDHFYAAMDSEAMQNYFASTSDDGFIGLTYYTSGARSFYTIDRPVREPADLAGQKIRIQDFRSQTELMYALGGSPVVMGFGDVYTALQTGMVDGAESNETALTDVSHGEVAHVFSYTEHTMIPDLLMISTTTWDALTAEDQEAVRTAAVTSTEDHKELWAETVEESIAEAQEMGVEFIDDVDRDAFRDATDTMIDEYRTEYPEVGDVLDVIDAAR